MNLSELETRLRKEGFDAGFYSLRGTRPPKDGFSLRRVPEGWQVIWFERGEENLAAELMSEQDACDFFYRRMISLFAVPPKGAAN